jgi:hypothetical protein
VTAFDYVVLAVIGLSVLVSIFEGGTGDHGTGFLDRFGFIAMEFFPVCRASCLPNLESDHSHRGCIRGFTANKFAVVREAVSRCLIS